MAKKIKTNRMLWVTCLALMFAIFCVLCLILAKMLSSNKGTPTLVTDKYIFSDKTDPKVFGEGFFVTFKDGKEIFVYGDPDREPRKIESQRLKVKTMLKNRTSWQFPAAQKREVYLSTKYDLMAEHRLLTPGQYYDLAQATRERGMSKVVNMVLLNDEDVKVPDAAKTFPCLDIVHVGEVNMTTGGSVHIFTITMKDGLNVNVDLGVQDPNGVGALEEVRQNVLAHKGEGCKMIITNPVYMDTQFTMRGAVPNVWVTSWKRISFE